MDPVNIGMGGYGWGPGPPSPASPPLTCHLTPPALQLGPNKRSNAVESRFTPSICPYCAGEHPLCLGCGVGAGSDGCGVGGGYPCDRPHSGDVFPGLAYKAVIHRADAVMFAGIHAHVREMSACNGAHARLLRGASWLFGRHHGVGLLKRGCSPGRSVDFPCVGCVVSTFLMVAGRDIGDTRACAPCGGVCRFGRSL